MSRMAVASQSSLWQTTSGSLKGSIPWLAIEFLKPGKLQYRHTKETDVWAFGMTIYVSKHSYSIYMSLMPTLAGTPIPEAALPRCQRRTRRNQRNSCRKEASDSQSQKSIKVRSCRLTVPMEAMRYLLEQQATEALVDFPLRDIPI